MAAAPQDIKSPSAAETAELSGLQLLPCALLHAGSCLESPLTVWKMVRGGDTILQGYPPQLPPTLGKTNSLPILLSYCLVLYYSKVSAWTVAHYCTRKKFSSSECKWESIRGALCIQPLRAMTWLQTRENTTGRGKKKKGHEAKSLAWGAGHFTGGISQGLDTTGTR